MRVYNKLVRDRIPAIVAASGKTCEVRTLEPAEYKSHLTRKLQEELAEFQESAAPEELADLVEVVYALVQASGMTHEQFEAMRLQERQERGGFDERLLLISVSE